MDTNIVDPVEESDFLNSIPSVIDYIISVTSYIDDLVQYLSDIQMNSDTLELRYIRDYIQVIEELQKDPLLHMVIDLTDNAVKSYVYMRLSALHNGEDRGLLDTIKGLLELTTLTPRQRASMLDIVTTTLHVTNQLYTVLVAIADDVKIAETEDESKPTSSLELNESK